MDLPCVPAARISDKVDAPLGHALCSIALAGSVGPIIPAPASLGKGADLERGLIGSITLRRRHPDAVQPSAYRRAATPRGCSPSAEPTSHWA